MTSFHLDDTINTLKGPTSEQIKVNNQWAAVALDKYHSGSTVVFEMDIDKLQSQIELKWDSNFSKVAMKEELYMAYHGGESLAWFILSVLSGYKYAEQTEIGSGVDYRFAKQEPNDDDLNFLDDFHYVEISGILLESRTNTLKGRIKDKHDQIDRGGKRGLSSSVIVTLFSKPKVVKEIHT